MRARTLRTLAALVATAVLCAACGDAPEQAGAPTASSAPHWQVHEGEGENAALVLPDARFGVLDRGESIPRMVMNLLPSGDLVFKANVWSLASAVEDERQTALAAIRRELTRLCASPDLRADDGESLVPVLFYADREAPWRGIREVLSILREPEIRARRVQWAVRVPSPSDGSQGGDHRVDGMLQEVVESTPPVLRIVADRGESWTAVRIFSPAGIHSFGPQASRIAEEAFLRKANSTWIDLERTLPALAEKHMTADVEVRDAEADVWFAYVAKTVDLLFGAGFEEVRLPQEGIVLMRPGDDG